MRLYYTLTKRRQWFSHGSFSVLHWAINLNWFSTQSALANDHTEVLTVIILPELSTHHWRCIDTFTHLQFVQCILKHAVYIVQFITFTNVPMSAIRIFKSYFHHIPIQWIDSLFQASVYCSVYLFSGLEVALPSAEKKKSACICI